MSVRIVALLVGLLVSAHAWAGDSTFTLTYNGSTYPAVILHAPPGPQTKPLPLVIILHGTGGSGSQMEGIVGLNALADAQGFLVAYPSSNGSQWTNTGSPNDEGYILNVLTAIEGMVAVNTSRVWIAGYSDGAGLAQGTAICNTPLFAGVVNIAELFPNGYGTSCTLGQPINVIVGHGTGDPVSPYIGQAGSLSALATAQTWATWDGCTTTTNFMVPDTLSDGTGNISNEIIYSGCTNGVTVTFLSVTDGGHTWPGGSQSSGPLGPESSSLNVSQLIANALSTPAHIR